MSHLIAIDQGTTSTRAIVFDAALKPVASAGEELRQIYPRPGEVEHDPEEIWSAVVNTVRAAMAKANVAAKDIAGIGITNQRETTIVWDRATGKPIHNAIVWQDRRTADICERLKADGHEASIAAKTGLLCDPYFSGTKISWLLDNVDGARAAARDGRLAFGTVDTFLLWRLTGGKVHATDATNASRTLLFDIRKGRWDEELEQLLDIPRNMLGEVRENAEDYGCSASSLFGGEIPILGMAGDQQAATIGQGCFFPGMMKATYGTGCFALAEHRGYAGVFAPPAAHDHRLSALTGKRFSPWRGRSSWLARRCSGCATGSASSSRRPTLMPWREGQIRRSRCIWCRPLWGSARRTGIRKPVA